MHFLRSGAHGLVEILSVFSTCRFGSSTSPVDIPCSFDFPSALWSILCLFILLLNDAQHLPPPPISRSPGSEDTALAQGYSLRQVTDVGQPGSWTLQGLERGVWRGHRC